MPKAKKESVPVSFRLATDVYERLESYCEKSGLAKTSAVERAINMYIDDYETKQRIIEEGGFRE